MNTLDQNIGKVCIYNMNQFINFKMQCSMNHQRNSSLLSSLACPRLNSKSSDLFEMLDKSSIEEYKLPYLKGDFEIDFSVRDLSDTNTPDKDT